MRLNGPSGELRTCNNRGDWGTRTSSLFRSLGEFNLSKTQRLSITACFIPQNYEIENSHIFHALLLMNNLCTLTFMETDKPLITHLLNPKQNKTHTVLCPALKELVIYIGGYDILDFEQLAGMASERAKRFSKLSSITVITLGGVDKHDKCRFFSLIGKHVSRVEYKVEVSPPDWDSL